MTSYDILVLILSILLGLLLLAGIFLLVQVIKLVKKIRQIVETAEEIVDDVGTVSHFFRQSTAPVALASLLSNIVSKVTQIKSKKEK